MIRAGQCFYPEQGPEILPLASLQGPLLLVIDRINLPDWIYTASCKADQLRWDILFEDTSLEHPFYECSPVLLRLETHTALYQDWLTDPDWQQHCLLISYPGDYEHVRQHLRSLIWMRQQDKTLLMRFYAPTILDTWAPSLTDNEAAALLGPAECWAWFSPSGTGEQRWSWMAHTPGQAGRGQGWFALSDAQVAALDAHDAPRQPANQAQPAKTQAEKTPSYIDYWLGYEVEEPTSGMD
ncbi:hypothetical protein WH50_05425 [Pokkaliibacter plantistimulans]|uniref:DUF4123 domain-containing protein n=1 Tax=Pokkaliibacter plantistimulans TaxID=1635171 RepID=A0ABX5M0V7_9GAMM|nr:DUF4123 domain-containing protein [Pokkaliibacter plantistimulans]PXF32176.1 hypothetical protein WH50_05425 [Pokkaliibacter plantistimulans]